MNREWSFRPPFKLPYGYRKMFLLDNAGYLVRLRGRHGLVWLKMDECHDRETVNNSLVWIRDVLETVQKECV